MPARKRKRMQLYPTLGPKYKKPKYKKAPTVTYNTGPRLPKNNILGQTLKTTLVYFQTSEITGSTTSDLSTGTVAYRANSLYDPENIIGGSGHQPRGFDQLSALYDEYVVTKATIEVRFQNTGATTRPYGFISMQHGHLPSIDFVEVNESADTIVSKKAMGRVTNGEESHYMSMAVDPVKWLGYKDSSDADQCKSTISSNPIETCLFLVGFCDPTNNTSTSVQCSVKITYECTFSQPREPGLS